MDFLLHNRGSLWLLSPKTERASDWCAENLPEDAPVWVGDFVIEPRYVGAVVKGIEHAGLVIYRGD